jgi:heme A synthase
VASIFLVALAIRRYRKYEGSARAVPILAIVLLLAEIGMGGAVVLLETPVRLTTVHFMTGLLVFLLAYYLMTFDGERDRPVFAIRGPAALFLSVAALVFFQSALGAYVRHLDAGLACPDFPACLGAWVPPLFAGSVLAHFSHRTLGYLVLLTASMLYLFVRRDTRQRRNRPLALSFLVLVAAQIGVGALVVLSGLHYLAAGLHLAVALGILAVMIHLWVNATNAEGKTLSLPRS